MKECKIGFIQGSFDMFNVDDLKKIETAKKQCEILIVGVYSDEMILKSNKKNPMIPCEERMKIVNSINGVGNVVKIDSKQQLLEKRDELKETVRQSVLMDNQNQDKVCQKKYKVGFIQGTFDMFHVGHLRLIQRAQEQCEQLIVGVNTDALVRLYKNKRPIVPFESRIKIIDSIKGVDRAIGMNDRNKIKAARNLKFDALIMGNDWQGTEFYNIMEEELNRVGVDIVYFPYTQGISSTALRKKLGKDADGKDLVQE